MRTVEPMADFYAAVTTVRKRLFFPGGSYEHLFGGLCEL
ncbi:hypothetical protein THTE_3283 [Thermogutta terrifontis]|uniref:Uncharacterized protein n=1 Tax=Thermogutta terrifontis TaxID=1331910 RepID=A0A286RIT6_9BACT|nr:hypothetical protein THTE_3283 [Thermogutta terrifontis]